MDLSLHIFVVFMFSRIIEYLKLILLIVKISNSLNVLHLMNDKKLDRY